MTFSCVVPRLLPLLLLASVLLLGQVASTTIQLANQRQETNWKACRINDIVDRTRGCPLDRLFNVSSLPTTALAVLLDNGQFPGFKNHERLLSMDDLYGSTYLTQLPDISQVGREFYTLVYQLDVETPPHEQIILQFAGIHYRSYAFWDGKPLLESLSNQHVVDGMFRRRHYHFQPDSKGRFLLVVEPPLHPGNFTATATSNPLQQQGGNHDLAKDGATAQFLLGWDWCQAMPDRSTGFFGRVDQEFVSFRSETNPERPVPWDHEARLLDPAVQTLQLSCRNLFHCSRATLALQARIHCRRISEEREKTLPTHNATWTRWLKVTSDWNETWSVPFSCSNNHDTSHFVDLRKVVPVEYSDQIKPWWPRGVGMESIDVAHLHSFQFAIQGSEGQKKRRDSTVTKEASLKTILVGIRSVATTLDPHTQGQVFFINGRKIYLVGGNWITTDQAFRFSASPDRYCQEIALHVHAGLNLIRVWGGGVIETDDFFDCADKFGLLIFQEFSMTGDNNGRWAGEYSWPIDHTTYLENVQDVALRLRRHPSLLFYGGCNECLAPRDSPWFPSPPRTIDDGIRSILNKFDPGRFYISSSMGGKNVADNFQDPSLWDNRSYSLAYADGPYGMLLPSEMFKQNPGLNVPSNVSIGFQPEIGSTSTPTYNGLLRFMSKHEADNGFPLRNNVASRSAVWEFHSFQPWLSAQGDHTYDHVYAYFASDYPVKATDWCFAAQLAAHAQYQHLLNAFITHMFQFTTAVILWKTQSPWPSLRGFLYDWYLESTGTLNGARASLQKTVSVVLNAESWRLYIINRQIFPLQSTRKAPITFKFTWFDHKGNLVSSETKLLPTSIVPAMSSVLLSSGNDLLVWPEACSTVCFLSLTTNASFSSSSSSTEISWYWLTDPALGDESDFSLLGQMRRNQKPAGHVTLLDLTCEVRSSSTMVSATIHLDADATEILFYPILSLRIATEPILPLMDDQQTNVVILPGTFQTRNVRTPCVVQHTKIEVRIESWNAPTVTTSVVC